jgi:hypothetical protein
MKCEGDGEERKLTCTRKKFVRNRMVVTIIITIIIIISRCYHIEFYFHIQVIEVDM